MKHSNRKSTTKKFKNFLYFVIVFSFASFYAFYSATTLEARNQFSPERSSSYIIEFKTAPASSPSPEEMIRKHGGKIIHTYEGKDVLNGVAASLSSEALQSLQQEELINSISLDGKLSIAATSSNDTPKGITRIKSDIVPVSRYPEDINVAVLDTGMDASHPEIKENVEGGRNFTSGDESEWDDNNGHGTHVAGIIGALDSDEAHSDKKLLGVSPKSNLFAAKAFNEDGKGQISDVISAIEWIRNQPQDREIDIVNMSFAGKKPENSQDPLHEVISAAEEEGITFVTGAGNQGEELQNTIPANYPEVISVAAMNPETDAFASFSNYGENIDVIAPGVHILSSWKNELYWRYSGTSAAAAHVSGTAALYIGNMDSEPSPEEVKTFLKESGTRNDWKGNPGETNYPLVNAIRAAFGEKTEKPTATVTVTDVIDGDTVEVEYSTGERETIRLLGVDTPETGSTDNNSPGEFLGVPDNDEGRNCLNTWGNKATEFMKAKVGGEKAQIKLDPEDNRRGVFGRVLAYIIKDGTNLNHQMVEDGLARVFDSNFSQRSRFFQAMYNAQQEFIGLWGDCAKENIQE